MLRRGVISLWFVRHRDDAPRPDLYAARTEADRLGAAADHARFRVQLLAEDPDLVALADAAFEPIGEIHHAADPDLDPLRAAWLQLGAGTPTARRLRAPDAVVSHRSAAAALGLGDLLPDVHEFYARIRRRLRREDVRIRVRAELPRQDWTVVRGLPVTTARKILADLLLDREDQSAVARIVQDALRAELLTSAELEDSSGCRLWRAVRLRSGRRPRRGRQRLKDRVSAMNSNSAAEDLDGTHGQTPRRQSWSTPPSPANPTLCHP